MRVLSLFSGCGGMDVGFEGGFDCLTASINPNIHPSWADVAQGDWVTLPRTGFSTVFANDIKPDAKSAWVSYFSKYYPDAENRYHLSSIVDLVKKAKQGESVFPNDIDIVTGGFPCQDFSVAGKRAGLNSHKSHDGKSIDVDAPSIENRGQLYIWMREVISITQPKLFVAENVKGLTNLSDVQQIIEQDFANAADGGYLVVPAKVLHAADYGVPQSRERVIFFGFKKSALTKSAIEALSSADIASDFDPYPNPTHTRDVSNVAGYLKPVVNCRTAFTDLLEPSLTTDVAQTKFSKAKFMGKHCQGQVEIKLDDISPTIRSEHHGNIEFRRLSEQHGGKYLDELQSGLMERRLTIRECARLQTFPDDYQFILPKTEKNVAVSASGAYKLIGNAVPCLLAYHIATNIKNKWEKYFGE